MPHDAEVAERVRTALTGRDVREVKMFGGLAFMVEDRMLVCASAGGAALLIRVAPADDAELLQRAGARRAEMGKGRSMGEGWITVEKSALASEDEFSSWLDAALQFHAQGSGKKRAQGPRHAPVPDPGSSR